MADYLMQNDENLTISEKRYIFAMRNRMIEIADNIPTKYKNSEVNCHLCGEKENMRHLYECKLNSENVNVNIN